MEFEAFVQRLAGVLVDALVLRNGQLWLDDTHSLRAFHAEVCPANPSGVLRLNEIEDFAAAVAAESGYVVPDMPDPGDIADAEFADCV